MGREEERANGKKERREAMGREEERAPRDTGKH